jgi:hypothetical protein
MGQVRRSKGKRPTASERFLPSRKKRGQTLGQMAIAWSLPGSRVTTASSEHEI